MQPCSEQPRLCVPGANGILLLPLCYVTRCKSNDASQGELPSSRTVFYDSFSQAWLLFGQENKHMDVAGQSVLFFSSFFLNFQPCKIHKHTHPGLKRQFWFSSTKNDGWLLVFFFCRDRTTILEWLWQKRHRFRNKLLFYWPNFAHGKTPSRLFKMFSFKQIHLGFFSLYEMNKLHHFRDRFQFGGSSNFILSD